MCEIAKYDPLLFKLPKGVISKNKNVDLVIIGRGGGAYEDLWEFNSEELANSIYNCSVPVISAVGHETDFTICDFVADMRAPTPSAAAELAVPLLEEIEQRLISAENKISVYIENLIEYKKSVLASYEQRCVLGGKHLISRKKQEIEGVRQRLDNSVRRFVEINSMELANKITALEALNPLSVLSRGYAYVCAEKDGKNVSSFEQVKSGDLINIKLNDGKVTASVISSDAEEVIDDGNQKENRADL